MFFKSLTNEEMKFCVKEGKAFIQKANEGDAKEIKMNGDGEVLGKFEITAGEVLVNGISAKINSVADAVGRYRIGYVSVGIDLQEEAIGQGRIVEIGKQVL